MQIIQRPQISCDEALFPALPVVDCSQYVIIGIEEYERHNGPLSGNEKVGKRLFNVETSYSRLIQWQVTHRATGSSLRRL
jgi:hypothetical protein